MVLAREPSDSALIRQVKTDMRDWALGKVIWVADRGFSSARNRRFLQQGAGYIIGEKLRSESPLVKAARPGRADTRWWPGTCRSRRCGSRTPPTGS